MSISANYIESIVSSFLFEIENLYKQTLKNNANLTDDQRKQLFSKFNSASYEMEEEISDIIGYKLCTNGKFNALFNRMQDFNDEINVFVSIDCTILKLMGFGLEEMMPKGVCISICGNEKKSVIKVLHNNKIIRKIDVKNLQFENNQLEK